MEVPAPEPRKNGGGKEKKPALILAFSPKEKESLFPLLVNLDALNLRRFRDARHD
jgi:hypothetical protein